MTHTEIINKLIGHITPVGETNADEKRFENLKAQCELVEALIMQIQHVARSCKGNGAHSIHKAGTYADLFLTEVIGITAQ
jgi:hypothetical protein